MSIAMPDSINVDNLPDGYFAYLGYVDGALIPPTVAKLRAKFPGAVIVGLTTTGGTLAADGCDCENGDLSPSSAAGWVAQKLATGYKRPILYASVSTMVTVLQIMADLGIPRSTVRLLSAHYGVGEHICGPDSCAYPGVTGPMDGTQWTDSYPGVNGAAIDMSLLQDSFFSSTPTPIPNPIEWADFDMTKIRVLKLGDADAAGEFWAVRRAQLLVSETGSLNGIPGAAIKADGVFGKATDTAVRAIQKYARLTVDGVVGPLTWDVLLTGSAQ